jgi:hypothetical protein
VDFETVGWDGPGEDWLQEHKLLTPRPLITPPDESNPTQLKLF